MLCRDPTVQLITRAFVIVLITSEESLSVPVVDFGVGQTDLVRTCIQWSPPALFFVCVFFIEQFFIALHSCTSLRAKL